MASQCNSDSYSSELALLRPYISVNSFVTCYQQASGGSLPSGPVRISALLRSFIAFASSSVSIRCDPMAKRLRIG